MTTPSLMRQSLSLEFFCLLFRPTTHSAGIYLVFKPKKQPRIGLPFGRQQNVHPTTILTDTFTITHCNVHGHRSKLDNLQRMMNEISPSVMCGSETNLNSGVIDSDVNIPGCTLLRLDRKTGEVRLWWRCCCYVPQKKTIHFRHFLVLPFISFRRFPCDKEVLWVKVNPPNKSFGISSPVMEPQNM